MDVSNSQSLLYYKREGERERERGGETERERPTETETDRDRQRDTERELGNRGVHPPYGPLFSDAYDVLTCSR